MLRGTAIIALLAATHLHATASPAGTTIAASKYGIEAYDLRSEYRVNPLGIGVVQPRLSWIVLAPPSARGVIQSSYRILVASSPQKLAQNQGDLWDTGKVDSNQTSQISYAGSALASRAACWWKVQLWDGQDAASPWSAPASWTVGLLSPSDWKAQWIGFDAPSDSTMPHEAEERLLKQKWISAPEPPNKEKPQTAFFRYESRCRMA